MSTTIPWRALRWEDEPPQVVLPDQTRLPDAEVELRCPDVPSLGVAGGYE